MKPLEHSQCCGSAVRCALAMLALASVLGCVRERHDGVALAPHSVKPIAADSGSTPGLPVALLPDPLPLEAAISLAVERNPMARAARHRWEAALQKRPQAVALPDPELTATRFSPTADDEAMVEAMQEIPWPGKLLIAGRVADREAEIARLGHEIALRDAIADVKEACFELGYIDRAMDVARAARALYERYAAIAAGGIDVGQTRLPEAFRAESQRAQLANDEIVLREIRAAQEERLRAALALPAGTQIGRIAEIDERMALEETAPWDLAQLTRRAEARNQELAAAGVAREKSRDEARLARRAPIPNLRVGATFIDMVGVPGEEEYPIGLTAGINIPIWAGKYRAMAREAERNEEAAEAEREGRALGLRAELAEAYFRFNNARRLARLYRQTLLPQARQAQQSAEELQRNGMASMAAVLETTATVYNFELAALRATADFFQNLARLEKIVGEALPFQSAPTAKMGGAR